MKIFVLLLLIISRLAYADGDRPLGSVVQDNLRITLFGHELRAGPNALSVLLQDVATGGAILDAEVQMTFAKEKPEVVGEAYVPPCCRMEDQTSDFIAKRGYTANKLLYGGQAIFPQAGAYVIQVRNSHSANTTPATFVINVEPPAKPLATWWPLLTMVPLSIGVFVLHGRLRRAER